jgi:hypothetical protein
MPICKDCKNKTDFTQHGYPSDFSVRMSCGVCKSGNVRNTFTENFFFYLQWCVIFIILSPLLVFIIPYFLIKSRGLKDE